jgi:phosphoglycerate kinase
MKSLPSVKDLPVEHQTVLLRTNYDVPLKEGKVTDTSRIDESLPTINYLLSQQAKVMILSHLGRPDGQVKPELSLKPVADYLSAKLQKEIHLQSDLSVKEEGEIVMLENLRFWPGEEKNDSDFAKQLAALGGFYVNDAFAVSHRQHASIIGLPTFLPSAFGLDSLEEIEVLGKIQSQPVRPVVVILGGVKEDKLALVEKLLSWADQILVGGKLPQMVKKSYPEKVIMAQLNAEGKDITLESVEVFQEVIKKAGTILWAGPMGLAEEEEFQEGTRKIAQAVVESSAFKVLGGGDTEAILTKFNLIEKIDYVSSGGGAMFEFLSQGKLPGIEVILNKNKQND